MASLTASFQYTSWEEVLVSSEKRQRVVHYFLKKSDGSLDLAVVAKEKNFRHFSYHCVLPKIVSSFTLFNPKSRRTLVLWLDSLLSDWSAEDVSHAAEAATLKDSQLGKLGLNTKEFLWLGPPWMCRKRRKHYQAFQRNGFKISVYDFVCVLAEDKNRVAYLEDMYEDSGGNKTAVVRWFYKIRDVGIVLPVSFCDREVFFSHYLQDLSIECIDGLATILNPQHYERFQNEARHTHLEPFICGNQFDNDLKPFDITQLQGYWKQELISYMYTYFDSKSNGSSGQSDDSQESLQHNASVRYKKRLHSIKFDCKDLLDIDVDKLQNLSNTGIDTKGSIVTSSSVMVAPNNLVVGSQVEVLSQDSGIRGCWFRASVIKKHKNKVKLLYQDIPDAVDETKKLEEWVSASKISVHDELCLRMYGRTRFRPASPSPKFEILLGVDVGSIVDAWWHDGWWEGIIVNKESEANYHVYFPGEKMVLVFGLDNLRCSQEWTGNEWVNVRDRPDLVTSILSSLKTKHDPCKSHDERKSTNSSIVDVIQPNQGDTCLGFKRDKPTKHEVFPDLLNDGLLSQLRWKSSRKRRRGNGSLCGKLDCSGNKKNKSPSTLEYHASDRFIIPSSFQVEHDMVMPLTNMVVCR